MIVDSDVPAAQYQISFIKQENSSDTSQYYLPILNLAINVMQYNPSLNAAPQIIISSISTDTIGYPVIVPIYI